MASPQARYQPQDYFSPPPAQARQRSSSAAARYSPQAYSHPPQPIPNQQLLAPNNYPLPPAGTSFRQEAPYPVEDPHASSYMNMPVAQRPLVQQAMIHSRRHSNDIFPMEEYQDEGFRRPSYQGEDYRRPSYQDVDYRRPSYQGEDYRRPSYQGEDYRRSSYADNGHEQRRASHHSDRSHRSHHSHHHDRDSDDDEYEEGRHKHHHHNHERHRSKSQVDDLDAYRQRKKDRGENVSRSFGDSMLAVMSPLKYLIEPRDKY